MSGRGGSRGRGSGGHYGQKRPRPAWNDSGTSSSTSAPRAPIPSPNSSSAGPELREVDVGITEFFAAGHRGFSGVLKTRFSDFIVHEIGLDGEVVRLTNCDVPPAAAPAAATNDAANDDGAALERLKAITGDLLFTRLCDAQKGVTSPDTGTGTLLSMPAPADKAVRKELHELVRRLLPRVDSATQAAVAAVEPSAANASNIVFSVRGSRAASSSSGPFQRYNKHPPWPTGVPEYTRFVLCKANWETPAAIQALATAMGAKNARSFSFAGLKDRRGVTCQLVTAWRVDPRRLLGACTSLRSTIRVGNFSAVKTRLAMGELGGNRFTLTIRNIGDTAAAAAAEEATSSDAPADGGDTATTACAALAAWASSGHRFINYFGLQRFGLGTVSTSDVGRMLIQGRWADAVRAILSPPVAPTSDPGEAAAAAADSGDYRSIFASTGDARAALARAPKYAHVELGLLRALVDASASSRPYSLSSSTTAAVPVRTAAAAAAEPTAASEGAPPSPAVVESPGSAAAPAASISAGAAMEALRSIPPRNRMLYSHAYQSLLWNELASLRIATYGPDTVVEGDLVLVQPDSLTEEAVEALGVDEDEGGGEGDHATAESTTTSAATTVAGAVAAAPEKAVFGHLPAVRPLSAAEASSGVFPITSIVMPQPGFSAQYPCNASGLEALAALLRRDGFPLPEAGSVSYAALETAVAALFKPRNRDYQLPGGYRHLVGVASGVHWELLRHARIDEDVTRSDLDEMMMMGGGGSGNAGRGGNSRRGGGSGSSGASSSSGSSAVAAPSSSSSEAQALNDASRAPTPASEPSSTVSDAVSTVGDAVSTVGDAVAGTHDRGDVAAPIADEKALKRLWIADEKALKRLWIADEKALDDDMPPSSGGSSAATVAPLFVSLRMSFSLSRSSYATMVIRELMRTATGKRSNAALNAFGAGQLPKESIT